MMDDTPETSTSSEKFDFTAYPQDTLFHERRRGADRRHEDAKGPAADVVDEPSAGPAPPRVAKERRARKERRRRIDPTTFEKQYTEDELEFMNAMQQFKVQSCKSFPTHGEVLQVAFALGYRKLVTETIEEEADSEGVGSTPEGPEAGAAIDLGIALSEGAVS